MRLCSSVRPSVNMFGCVSVCPYVGSLLKLCFILQLPIPCMGRLGTCRLGYGHHDEILKQNMFIKKMRGRILIKTACISDYYQSFLAYYVYTNAINNFLCAKRPLQITFSIRPLSCWLTIAPQTFLPLLIRERSLLWKRRLKEYKTRIIPGFTNFGFVLVHTF